MNSNTENQTPNSIIQLCPWLFKGGVDDDSGTRIVICLIPDHSPFASPSFEHSSIFDILSSSFFGLWITHSSVYPRPVGMLYVPTQGRMVVRKP